MYRVVTIVLLLALALAPDHVQAQVTGGTGKIGFQLSNYGRIRINTPAWTGGIRQVDRASAIVALDSTAVYDYNDNSDTVSLAQLVTGGIADVQATCVTNNDFPPKLPPNVTIRTTVYGWNNDSFLLYRFAVRNDSSKAVKAYIATAVVPEPGATYGAETIEYNTTKKVAYYYRTGEPAHVGFKVVSKDPYSMHSMDWDVYSTDPNNEVTTDAIRCFLTTPPGFDATLTGGVDGSFMHLTAGSWTIQPGDSVVVVFALLYAESPAAILALADSAQARYNGRFTSVKPVSREIPDRYELRQNYPNPFNPSTQIGFDIARAGFVTLKVYNLLGQEVATLVKENLTPGAYTATFAADAMPSGMYIARLTTDNFSATKRMLLLK